MDSRRRTQLASKNSSTAWAILLAGVLVPAMSLAAPPPPNTIPLRPVHWSALRLPDDLRTDAVPILPQIPFDSDARSEMPTLPDGEPRSETFLSTDTPRAYPNPSLGPVTIELGNEDLSVEVYDAAGRRVAHVLGRTGRAVWDGRDGLGELTPSGVYFARVEGGAAEGRTVRLVRR
jgi:hypothetical protein